MTLLFLIAVLFVIPFLSYKSQGQIHLMEELDIPRAKLYLQSLFMQGILTVLAYFALRSAKLEIKFIPALNIKTIGAGLGLIVLAWALSSIRMKTDASFKDTNLKYILPRNGKEQGYWLGTTFISSFMEEFVYRGVLFLLFYQTFDNNWWLGALASAVVFGFSHATQGTASVLFIIPFGLAFQFLYQLSGGLLLPIVTHFVYNTGVNIFFAKQILKEAKREDKGDDNSATS
ncbi:MAG: CPBP family intramembrane metalloprotease [Sphingobacteriales bacterium]|nr:CPBP family intramembrane metalloprotease [Sphingobacteriales bacterium]MBI3718453.1 CPBP family intramembrane metalloprotease [Sphingobacteriales bacterium]